MTLPAYRYGGDMADIVDRMRAENKAESARQDRLRKQQAEAKAKHDAVRRKKKKRRIKKIMKAKGGK